MGCIIPGNNGFFKELASLVLQTEAIDCPEKYIPLGPEWILPLFDTAHIENSYCTACIFYWNRPNHLILSISDLQLKSARNYGAGHFRQLIFESQCDQKCSSNWASSKLFTWIEDQAPVKSIDRVLALKNIYCTVHGCRVSIKIVQ